MKYLVSLFIWILIASGWPLAAQQSEAAQVSVPQPAEIRIDHDIDAVNARMLSIFLSLLHNTGLHGAFVEKAVCSDLPKGSLRVKHGATVRQAMDALVAANPGYQWELRDGAVNLMPRGSAPLLRVRIAKFQMNATDQEILVAIGDVLNLPKVREREASLGLKEGMGGIGLSSGQAHPVPRLPVPVHIEVHNLSVQDVFNKIVQTVPKGVWTYYENDCDGAKTFVVQMISDY